jgi:hypothetical protein
MWCTFIIFLYIKIPKMQLCPSEKVTLPVSLTKTIFLKQPVKTLWSQPAELLAKGRSDYEHHHHALPIPPGMNIYSFLFDSRKGTSLSRAGSMYFGALGKTSKWGLKKKFK